jgi:hypothetical protein
MSHIVAKRATKEAAEKEASRARVVLRGRGAKITVKKYGKQYGVFIE